MTTATRHFAPRGAPEIGRHLETKVQELDQLSIDLQAADEVRERVEEEWLRHLDETIETLMEDDGRLPGEDVRLSIARRGIGWDKWTNWRRAERTVRRYEKRATQISTGISALQTEAKLLRENV